MQRDDLVRLGHMLDAARDALVFAADKDRSDLDTDRMVTFAIMKESRSQAPAWERTPERSSLSV